MMPQVIAYMGPQVPDIGRLARKMAIADGPAASASATLPPGKEDARDDAG
jgi:hypothetical protein